MLISVSRTGSSDVVKSVGDSVQLDTQDTVPEFDELFWVFNGSTTVVKYYNQTKQPKHYPAYKDRVEFNEGTYSLTLKNLQKTDSGLYEARASGYVDRAVAEYSLSVLDPVEDPVLTHQVNRTTCNITLTCRGHDLSINSSCNKKTCEEKEVTSPGGLVLSLSVRGSSIICNHSNPVSWKNKTLEMGELKRLCTDGRKGVTPTGPPQSRYYVIGESSSALSVTYMGPRPETVEMSTVYSVVQKIKRTVRTHGGAQQHETEVGMRAGSIEGSRGRGRAEAPSLQSNLRAVRRDRQMWSFRRTRKPRGAGECRGGEAKRCRHPPPLVNIRGMDIERVDSYKYLGVHLNNKLGWSVNTTALHIKGQSRLYLLRRLRSCGVQGALLRTFFHTVVASAIFYGVVCWGSSISTADRKRLDQLLKRAGSVLGSPLDPVQVVGDRRMFSKLASMLENDSHPMHETLAALGSSFSTRLLHPKCVEERYRRYIRKMNNAAQTFTPHCNTNTAHSANQNLTICLVLSTGSSDVVRSVGGSVQLDIRDTVPEFDELIWEFNKTTAVVKYYNEFKKGKQFPGYEDRVEFNEGTYTLTLKNLQKTDSGLYEVRTSGAQVTAVAEYSLSVLDPVEAPVLTLQVNRDTCNITLTCIGHDLSINSSCYNGTCKEKNKTSPGGVTLSLSVRGSSIICNHSNPVSWKEDVLEMGKLKRPCTDGGEGEHRAHNSTVVVVSIVVAVVTIISIITSVYIIRRRSPGVSEEQLYSSVPGVSGGGTGRRPQAAGPVDVLRRQDR
ncbi:hypothetical protein NFI96_031824 [Prochilodus magdalenae]|nr:hypothetical protein NFI96_031824 [Prochilodus magdalenae]